VPDAMTDCPFCGRVRRGEFDYSDKFSVAFPPRNPVTPGHFLVVPRRHVASALEAPLAASSAVGLAAELAGNMGLTACNIITSCGAAATQTVFHLHVHVVPRTEGDGLHLPWTGQQDAAGLLAEAQRFQVQEARDCLGTWDLARAPGVTSRESVLAGQVRALIAIIDAVAPVTGEENDGG
jgi:histidine triad (HIT) family protein